MKDTAPHLDAINGFSSKRILVIGDLLLDIYLKGRSTRLCPEAPVPVVDVRERTVLPGGAANTVCNLVSLGASVVFCTVVGKDREGDEAIGLLKGLGVDDATIVRDSGRKTMTKSRVVSGSQVITRIDQGSEHALDETTTEILTDYIERAYDNCDAIIISDYDKGIITPALIHKIATLQTRKKKFLAIDSKRLQFFSSLEPAYVKPNYEEALKILSLVHTGDRIGQIIHAAEELFTRTNAALITVTLDEAGSLIIEHGKTTHVVSAPFIPQPYVAGAGDSYISAFALSYLHSGDPLKSAEIATAAAAIAIRKESTAPCSHAELKSYFHIHAKFIAGPKDLSDVCNVYHAAGKKIVFTNGCFDILHSGHVTYLRKAKEMGDILIVGLNTDDSIKRIKGDSRPINGLTDRLQVLAGLSSVDHIVAFGTEADDTPVPLIRVVRPHIFAKGGDYTKEKLPEAETVEAGGGEIVFIDHIPDHSTTRIINRITAVTTRVDTALSGLP